MIQYLKKVDGVLLQLPELEPGCWINIVASNDKKPVEDLSEALDIPLDFFIDSMDVDERSRFERDDDVDLIVLNTPIKNQHHSEFDADYITVPVGIILLKKYIITVSTSQTPVIDYFINRHVKDFDPSNFTDFILRIFNQTVYYFQLYLKRINHQRNLYEKELFNSSRNTELAKLMNLQKSLVYFVTSLRDNELLMNKVHRADLLRIKQDEDASDFLEGVIIDASQAREMSDIYNNILNGTMDAFASIISNNLNQVMKRLTAVTIVLMVPTLLASFYGMNVHLPFEDHKFAALYVLLASVVMAVLVMYIFVRNRLF
ncbi:MAG: magnesium transporter CorA family protein [Chitinophagales bacterium]|nr:magnesium transporter CorA family protein [Bacteroidota bacterium]MCB9043048.1 magnesium transporter CorA family protein [Chitinophagales bacterium]